MKTENYIKKIVKATGLSRKEIQDLVENKKKELKGLISEEGALFVIAKELGVDVKEENKELLKDIEIKTTDISPNMKNITLVGRVRNIRDVYTFDKKDGSQGQVASFVLADNEGEIRVVLWDQLANIVNDPAFEKNELVKILNAYAKKDKNGNTEIHLGRLGRVIIGPEDVDYKKYPKIKQAFTSIKNVSLNDRIVSIKGKILQKFPINEFTRKDGEKGKVQSMNLMDQSGTIRVTFWNEDVEKLSPFQTGDSISITGLSPRLSTYDEKTIELYGNSNTELKEMDDTLEVEADQVEKISELQERKGIVSFKGVINSVRDLKKVTTKSGEELSLFSFTVGDESDAIRATLWREDAENYAEKLNVGEGVYLKNVLIKFSSFSGRNEINLIKNSEIESIDLEIKADQVENIKELQERKGIVSFKGVISSVENLKKVTTKSGEELSLFSFTVSDESDAIRATLWREDAENYAEKLNVGEGVYLKNVLIKFSSFSGRNEVNFNNNSEIEFIDLEIEKPKYIEEKKISFQNDFSGDYKKINEIKSPEIIEIKGFIAKGIRRIFVYEACERCFKKKENCSCNEDTETVDRMIFNLIIDDGTDTMRATFIGDIAEKFLKQKADLIKTLKETPDFENFLEKKSDELLGKDLILKGKTKFSEFSQSYELMVYQYQELDVDEELNRIMKEIEV
ncbi:MAG: DUF2240 family protein [Promethearchaeota archaeon]|nr:MAG: DUF2240 family protein [Candidatus Lokiarchaeota archaeon]